MKLDLIKQKLSQLQSKGKTGTGEKKDYEKLFWKPTLGKHVVRIVPSRFNKDYPFKEIWLHQFEIFKKTIPSLRNWNQKDPVEELIQILKKSQDPSDWALVKKLAPKMRTYVNIIVRGEEERGVRLWEFGKQTYEKILNIMSQDDEYGDITDLIEGTDLTIEGYEEELKFGDGKKSTKYIAVNVTPKRKVSPLSEDEEEIKTWITSQTDPLTLNTKSTFEEIKTILKNYLDPQEAEEETVEEVVEETVEETDDTPVVTKASSSKNGKVGKKKVTEEAEEEEDLNAGAKDDLPFVVDEEDDKPKKKALPETTKKKVNQTVADLKTGSAKKTPTSNNKKKFDVLFDN